MPRTRFPHRRRTPAEACRKATPWTVGGCSPAHRDWSAGLAETWTPGEGGAHSRLQDFLDGPVEDYGTGRDRPGVESTSRLSPHLRFGEISPFRVWHALRERFPRQSPADVGIFSQ